MSDKTKVIATKTIVRTVKPGTRGDSSNPAGIRPETQTINVGAVFMTTGKEEKELRAQKAIRDWTAEDERILNSLSNVIGGGEFETHVEKSEDDGTASVTKTTKAASNTKPKGEAGKPKDENVI